ncbi:MAG: nuclear transport factor 2 family protein [Ekhidna sp.]
MKLLSTLVLLIIAAGCSEKRPAPLQKLSASIEWFNDAYVAGDTATLARMITENYVHTNSSWKSFGKEKWMSYMRSRKEKLVEGKLVVSDYTMDQYAVELHENTAIVTARISSRGVEDGVEFNKVFRVTNLWVYNGSDWQRAAFHDTAIK